MYVSQSRVMREMSRRLVECERLNRSIWLNEHDKINTVTGDDEQEPSNNASWLCRQVLQVRVRRRKEEQRKLARLKGF